MMIVGLYSGIVKNGFDIERLTCKYESKTEWGQNKNF